MKEVTSFDEEKNQNQTPSFVREYQDYQNSSNSSSLSQSRFLKHYHYLCKRCTIVPILNFSPTGIIKFECECDESPRKLNIKNIYDLLYYSEEIDYGVELLKCYHDGDFEKYISYCKECKKNLCHKCSNGCIMHSYKEILFASDTETFNKSEYIIKKINEKNNIETHLIL